MYKWNENITKLKHKNKNALILPQEGVWVKLDESLFCAIDKYLNGEFYNCETNLEKIINEFNENKLIVNTNSENVERFSDNKIKSIYFSVTKRCNLACEFCCVESSYLVKENALSFNEIKNAVDKLSGIKFKRIIITGGEPCLRKDLIPIIDYMSEKLDCKIALCSNGLLLTDELIKNFNKKVSHIDISVENLLEDPQIQKSKNINSLKNLINKLKHEEVDVGLSFVVTKKNYNHIYEFIDICHKYNTDISIKIVAPIGNAKINSKLLLSHDEAYAIYKNIYIYVYKCKYENEKLKRFLFPNLIPKINCSAMDKIMAISPNGKTYSCHTLMDEKFYLGDIKNNTMKQIMDNKIKKSKSQHYKNCFDITKRHYCSECDVKYFCGGNCYAEIFNNENNEYIEKRALCDFYKKLYNFLLWDYSDKKSLMGNLCEYISIL